MNAIQKNSKTLTSCDFTTDCPKRREGKACKYCYVESAREAGYNAKRIESECSYNHDVLGFTAKRIESLNAAGGIRLFSFGDYMVEHKALVQAFLDDCHSVGLRVKAITKQPLFVETFGNHPAIAVIHVSVDTCGDGVPHDVALDLRERFEKVLIRAAIMQDSDVETLGFVDILTFNHARGLKKYGFKLYKKAHVAAWAERFPKKVCCQTGSCATCPILCGQK